MEKTIVLAGGSGFLGQSLAGFLVERDYEVIILTRGRSRSADGFQYVHWDGKNIETDWAERIDGCHAVVNFTGKSVNCIYTRKNKQEIVESRLDSVKVLHKTVVQAKNPPSVFVQAGSLAIFGDTTKVCDEKSPQADGFSADVCKQWEKAFFSVKFPETRQVMLRIGFALGKDGGALEPLRKLARFNLGGTIGSGKQYISWLHIDDLNAMFLEAIENEQLTGIFNATGPAPVTNKEFMKTLRKAMNKGWSPPAPAPFVRLGAYVIMKADPGLALTGRNCIPKKFTEHGFEFQHTDLEMALRDLV